MGKLRPRKEIYLVQSYPGRTRTTTSSLWCWSCNMCAPSLSQRIYVPLWALVLMEVTMTSVKGIARGVLSLVPWVFSPSSPHHHRKPAKLIILGRHAGGQVPTWEGPVCEGLCPFFVHPPLAQASLGKQSFFGAQIFGVSWKPLQPWIA